MLDGIKFQDFIVNIYMMYLVLFVNFVICFDNIIFVFLNMIEWLILQIDFVLELMFDCGEISYVGYDCFVGCWVLVIGGDFGLGRVIIIVYMCEGVLVVINYFFEEEVDVQDLVDFLLEEFLERFLIWILGNLLNIIFCDEFVDWVVEEFGGFDIFVNNVG